MYGCELDSTTSRDVYNSVAGFSACESEPAVCIKGRRIS
jgi:hypothetical protein